MSNTKEKAVIIKTLGNFQITSDLIFVSEMANRSNKMWVLFKYLLTNRGVRLSKERITETLWPEDDYENMNDALKTLVYRLKKTITSNIADKKAINIDSSQGCYRLIVGSACLLDCEQMESLINTAKSLASENNQESIKLIRNALSLYKGDFLPEINSSWVFPERERCFRVYRDGVVTLGLRYKKEQMFDYEIDLYKKALRIAPYEEIFYIRIIEALLGLGRTYEALAYYEHSTLSLYADKHIKPSPELLALYKQIRNIGSRVELDLNYIQEMISERNSSDGAYFCQPEVFKALYRLEARKNERDYSKAYLGLLTITRSDFSLPSEEILEKAMYDLSGVVKQALRKSDAYTHWNKAQLLILLTNPKPGMAPKILSRIDHEFKGVAKTNLLITKKTLKTIPDSQSCLAGNREV